MDFSDNHDNKSPWTGLAGEASNLYFNREHSGDGAYHLGGLKK